MDKVYQEQYENYVGRRFYHKSSEGITYTFAEINENDKAVVFTRNLEISEYDVEEVLGLIRDNVWILEN